MILPDLLAGSASISLSTRCAKVFVRCLSSISVMLPIETQKAEI
jgi:hypothetical protein